MIKRRKCLPFNSPAVAGFPKVYQKGDLVKTRDGVWGVVIDSKFQDNLILYKDNKPSKGFFIVTVDHGGYTSQYLRHDLSGKRLDGGFW